MVDLDIIQRIQEFTDWVNTLFIVSKPKGTSESGLILNLSNKAIKRKHRRLPEAEEIITEMVGVQFFC